MGRGEKVSIEYILSETSDEVEALIREMEDNHRDLVYSLNIDKTNSLPQELKITLEERYLGLLMKYGDDAHSDYFQDQISKNL